MRMKVAGLVLVLAMPACAGQISDCAKVQLAIQLACGADPTGPVCADAKKEGEKRCGIVVEPPPVTPPPVTPPPVTPPPVTPPPVEPPPVTPPPVTPPTSWLIQPVDAGYRLDVNCRKYGNGIDCTLWVLDAPEFCHAIHGAAAGRNCHLDGHPNRFQAELELLAGKCFTFEYRSGAETGVCHDDREGPAVSCDHFGLAGGPRDDPQTVNFEGPQECISQRDEFGPIGGFWVMPQCTPGRECAVRGCIPGGPCSEFVIVDWK